MAFDHSSYILPSAHLTFSNLASSVAIAGATLLAENASPLVNTVVIWQLSARTFTRLVTAIHLSELAVPDRHKQLRSLK